LKYSLFSIIGSVTNLLLCALATPDRSELLPPDPGLAAYHSKTLSHPVSAGMRLLFRASEAVGI
jgi:hypothetical protein